MDNVILRKVQLVQLEIAKEIDETLEKGGICIIGGKNQIDQCDLDEVISL